MKVKSFILSLVLCVITALSLFGLTGCGDTSLSTIKENFDKLEVVYQNNSEIFKEGTCQGLQTKYLINYGTIVDKLINDETDEYVQLYNVYNVMLAISSDFIDSNKGYVINFEESKLSSTSKKCLNSLNESLIDYTKSIDKFLTARSAFVTHSEQFKGSLNDDANLAYLRKFKKLYGELVTKNIQLSIDLAKSIESTEIFELLKKTEPTENDSNIIKDYIRAKMLPIFSEFMITEIENNLNWKAQEETEAKTRIDVLLAKLNEEFNFYKTNFVGGENFAVMTKEEMTELFDLIDVFFDESESYFKALKYLNISSLAINYYNNLEKYKKDNALAEVYLEKLEQFINYSLDNFTEKTLNFIYKNA